MKDVVVFKFKNYNGDIDQFQKVAEALNEAFKDTKYRPICLFLNDFGDIEVQFSGEDKVVVIEQDIVK